jgi:hypothetical protein
VKEKDLTHRREDAKYGKKDAKEDVTCYAPT